MIITFKALTVYQLINYKHLKTNDKKFKLKLLIGFLRSLNIFLN